MGTHRVDRTLIVNTKYDRRRKLTPEQEFDLKQLSGTMSQRQAAAMFGVSRRTVIFIWNPEKLEHNKEVRRLRGTNYNTPQASRENIASLRKYKKELISAGVLTLASKEK